MLNLFTPELLILLGLIAGSIVLVGAASLSQMRLLAAGWSLYSLFSRMGAAEMLAIQLTVIALAYVAGDRLNRLTHAFGRGLSPDKVRIELYKIGRSRKVGVAEAVFVVGLALVFAWLVAADGRQAPLFASASVPATALGTAAGPGARSGHAAAHRGATPGAHGAGQPRQVNGGSAAVPRPLPTTPDIRHCLTLGSPEAIVKCSETIE